MLLKFLARGTGSAQAAAAYLTARDRTARARSGRTWRSCAAIRTPWPRWPTPWSSSTSTRRACSPGRRRTSRATRRSTGCSTRWSRPPGPGWNRIATHGRRCSTARPPAACTCMCLPRGATWRPARASISRRRAGSRPMARSSRRAISSTAGAARTIRRAPGISSRGTAPISTRRRCGRGSRRRTIPVTRSRPTYCSASRPGRCRTEPASSRPSTSWDSTCRARAKTT